MSGSKRVAGIIVGIPTVVFILPYPEILEHFLALVVLIISSVTWVMMDRDEQN